MVNEQSMIKPLTVFVSSPSDVIEERRAIQSIITKINQRPFIQSHFVLRPLLFEQETPPLAGQVPQQVVDRYIGLASNADIVIFILWSKIGTPFTIQETQKQYLSGTLYEFEQAYYSWKQRQRPQILLYRSMKPMSPETDPKQLEQVQLFFQRFMQEQSQYQGMFYRYASLEEFSEVTEKHLEHLLRERLPLTALASQREDFIETLPPRHSNFIGRTESIERITTTLLHNKHVQIRGLGGIGKTQLAIEIAYRLQKSYDHIIWLSAIDNPTRDDVLASLATIYKVDAGVLLTSQKRMLLREKIGQNAPLIVFDNVENYQDRGENQLVTDITSILPSCMLLCTSRPPLIIRGTTTIELDVLPTNESLALFQDKCGYVFTESELPVAIQICQDILEGFPLAIELAAKQMEVKKVDVSWLYNSLSKYRMEALELEQSNGIRLALQGTYDLLDPVSKVLFATLSVFAGHSFSLEAIYYIAEIPNCDQQLNILMEFSLVRFEGERYSLHPLVKDFARSYLHDTRPYFRMIAYYIQFASKHVGNIEALENEKVNTTGAIEWAMFSKQADDYLLASLFNSAISALHGEDPYYSFLLDDPYRQKGIGSLRQVLQESSSDTVSIEYGLSLGLLYYWRGEHSQARNVYKMVERRARRSHHIPGMIHLCWQKGYLEDDEDHYRIARNVYQDSFNLATRYGDSQMINIARELIGVAEYHWGHYPRAKDLITESLRESQASHDSSGISRSERRLGGLARVQGLFAAPAQKERFFAEGRIHLNQCLQIEKGERSRARALRQLGMIDATENFYDSAERNLSESLEVFRKLQNRKGEAAVLYNLAQLAYQQGIIPKAEQLCQESLRIGQQIGVRLGVALNLQLLACIRQSQQKHEEAGQRLKEAERLLRTIGSPYYPYIKGRLTPLI